MLTVGITTTTVYFLPVTAPASTISSTVNTLPTTAYISDGTTQIFSQDQFPDLTALTTPEIITTTFVPRPTDASTTPTSTPPGPVWVQSGGFYWSPVATGVPLQTAVLPEYPSVPSADCFTLLGLFSIDCPPDKEKPTSTFSSGVAQQTCTTGCGTLCTANCETTGTASSEPCTTQTVTDYWVTCSGSACTTTSSDAVTGCYLTATATTTGNYCPTGVTVSPDDDQGEEGTFTMSGLIAITKTKVESVAVSGTAYTVTKGTIVVSGTTLTVPEVGTSTTVVLLDGYTATVVPAWTGVVSVLATTTTSLYAASCSDTEGLTIPRATASALISEFCGYEGGKTISVSGPVALSYDNVDSAGTTVEFQIDALGTKEDGGCADFTLDEATCEKIYDSIVDACSSDNDGQGYYGGWSSQGCWKYTL